MVEERCKMTTPGERLALLKKEKGTLAEVYKSVHEYTYIVYNKQGDILYKSIQEPTTEYAEFKFYKFKTKDCLIIDENQKSIDQFYIEEDEHNVCHIKLKTFETATIKSEKDFLWEVEYNNSNSYNIKVNLNEKTFKVSMHGKTIEQTTPKQNLTFYITEKHDPHFIVEVFNIDIASLYNNKQVEKLHNLEHTDFSIYTLKQYDKYVRI